MSNISFRKRLENGRKKLPFFNVWGANHIKTCTKPKPLEFAEFSLMSLTLRLGLGQAKLFFEGTSKTITSFPLLFVIYFVLFILFFPISVEVVTLFHH
jgi:hypothetical protein